MKTIRGTKGFLIILAMALTTTSCVPSSNKANKSSSNLATVQTTNSSSNATTNDGPQAAQTPQTGSITYYETADEDNSKELPGVAYNSCGVLYKQLNNDNTFFLDNNGGDILIVQQYSYDSATILNEVKSINDSASSAYNTCLEGYIDSGIVYLNSATQTTATSNPTLTKKENYTYEYCGHIAHTTYSANNWTIIKVANKDFIVKNKSGHNQNSNIPTVGKTISSTNAIEACVYSNRPEYVNSRSSFYHVIDAAAIDLGAFN